MIRSDDSEENVNFALTYDEVSKAAVTVEFDEGVQFETLVS